MTTTYIDPLIPPNETGEETLTRLSANIDTLTKLMNDAEQMGHYSLAAMLNRARDAKVRQAEEIIALVTADNDQPVDDRRFLLVRDPDSVSAGLLPLRQKQARSPGQLALNV